MDTMPDADDGVPAAADPGRGTASGAPRRPADDAGPPEPGRPSAPEFAFDAVYHATAPRLVQQLYLVIGDLAEAQDCVQEAYARALDRWDRIVRGGDSVGWIKVTAYRLAVSRWRHVSAGVRALLRHGVPRDVPGPSAETIAVRDALARLPLNQRTALVLYHFNDLSVDEIAEFLQVPSGTVKARLSRGRKALAELLADDPDPGSPNGPGSPSGATPNGPGTPSGVRDPQTARPRNLAASPDRRALTWSER